MSYESTGFIKSIGEIQSFGSKGFKKCEVVMEIPDGKYPQTVAFEFQGDRCDLPAKYSEGDEVTITFDLKGRLHEASGRVYNTLHAWKISGNASPAKSPAPMSRAGLAQTSLNPSDDTDTIPF